MYVLNETMLQGAKGAGCWIVLVLTYWCGCYNACEKLPCNDVCLVLAELVAHLNVEF